MLIFLLLFSVRETTQWTWNTLGLVINDKTTFTTFICDFAFFIFTPFPSSNVSGDTIKYPIKFCIFYNLMRDLCVRTFFSVQENIIQKIKEIHAHTWTWRRECLGSFESFSFPTAEKESEKSLSASSVCADLNENSSRLFFFISKNSRRLGSSALSSNENIFRFFHH